MVIATGQQAIDRFKEIVSSQYPAAPLRKLTADPMPGGEWVITTGEIYRGVVHLDGRVIYDQSSSGPASKL